MSKIFGKTSFSFGCLTSEELVNVKPGAADHLKLDLKLRTETLQKPRHPAALFSGTDPFLQTGNIIPAKSVFHKKQIFHENSSQQERRI